MGVSILLYGGQLENNERVEGKDRGLVNDERPIAPAAE